MPVARKEGVDVAEERDSDGVVFALFTSGKAQCGSACTRRPVVPGKIGDCEEHFPNVLGSVVELVGERRPQGGDVVLLRFEPVGQTIPQDAALGLHVSTTEPLDVLFTGAPL